MATRPKNEGTPATRLEDEPKAGDEELAAAAGGDGRRGEILEPIGVSEAEVSAAERRRSQLNEPMVRLINMTMGNASLRVPAGAGVARETVPPFGVSSPLPLSYAKRQNRRRDPSRKYESNRQTWAVEPQARPAQWKPETFTDKETGQIVSTDSYRPSDDRKNPKGRPYRHSVRQAQQYLSGLISESAVRRYTRLFDNRSDVLGYAHMVMSAIRAREAKLTGMGDGDDDEKMV